MQKKRCMNLMHLTCQMEHNWLNCPGHGNCCICVSAASNVSINICQISSHMYYFNCNKTDFFLLSILFIYLTVLCLIWKIFKQVSRWQNQIVQVTRFSQLKTSLTLFCSELSVNKSVILYLLYHNFSQIFLLFLLNWLFFCDWYISIVFTCIFTYAWLLL